MHESQGCLRFRSRRDFRQPGPEPAHRQPNLTQRLEIVVAGNVAKFSQNPPMLETLLATGDKTLVEASPFDRIWGIGLRADDARVYDPTQWRGENLLGQALVEVRQRLR